MNINNYLIKNDISQYALSKNSNIPYSTISDICLKKTDIRKCTVETALKLANALNCTIEDLLSDDEAEFDYSQPSMTIIEFYQQYMKNRKNVILFGENALDFLRVTNGGIPLLIEVYSTTDLPLPFKVHKVKNFKKIDYVIIDGVMCSTIDQSFNDMLENDDTDLQELDEALCNYYYSHNESFDDLHILEKNMERFNFEKQIAINYYDTNQ